VDESVRPYPSRIAYGKPVPGFVEQMAAQPLTPGCYFATASGSGGTAFTVDTSGVVRELESIPPLDHAGHRLPS
jgi:hypothetical protein